MENPNSNMKDECMSLLKKDPTNMLRLKHPSILKILEQPGEDDKYICFITEPVEYSLACLIEAKAGGLKEHLVNKVPVLLETKVIILDMLEVLNFLH